MASTADEAQVTAYRYYAKGPAEPWGVRWYAFMAAGFENMDEALEAFDVASETFEFPGANSHVAFDRAERFDGPDLYDESNWRRLSSKTGGMEADVFTFRDDTTVHTWVAVGFQGDLQGELEDFASEFLVRLPDSVNGQTILSMLPGGEDVPDGYVLVTEKIIHGGDA